MSEGVVDTQEGVVDTQEGVSAECNFLSVSERSWSAGRLFGRYLANSLSFLVGTFVFFAIVYSVLFVLKEDTVDGSNPQQLTMSAVKKGVTTAVIVTLVASFISVNLSCNVYERVCKLYIKK